MTVDTLVSYLLVLPAEHGISYSCHYNFGFHDIQENCHLSAVVFCQTQHQNGKIPCRQLSYLFYNRKMLGTSKSVPSFFFLKSNW